MPSKSTEEGSGAGVGADNGSQVAVPAMQPLYPGPDEFATPEKEDHAILKSVVWAEENVHVYTYEFNDKLLGVGVPSE